jgi:RNA methyltransferase, TrmH family
MAELITSAANPRLREAARLRDRRDRERTGLILIDGAREVERAAGAGVDIERVFVSRELCRNDACRRALRILQERGVPLLDVAAPAFERLAYGDRGEGLVAVARPPATDLGGLRLPPEPLVGILDAVEKPGNVGAVLRSADGAGLDAVVLADERCDPWNPNAIRASLGTVFTTPIAIAPADEVRGWIRARGMRSVVARVEGSRRYTEVDLRGSVALVLGSEAEGLGAAWAGTGVEAVSIPMRGVADSLNVSVAAALLFYEALRQRQADAPRQRRADAPRQDARRSS